MPLKGYEKALALAGASAATIALGYLLVQPAAAQTTKPANMFFHIKNDPTNGLNTVGKVAQVYSAINSLASPLGYSVGLEPQCVTSWIDQLSYLQEFSKIPVMLNAWTSDDNYQISTSQIIQAMNVCPVKYLRFHEVMSYYASTIDTPAVQSYIQSILSFSKFYGVPLFWNEWDPNTYPAIASMIAGFEDNVFVSFGTNNAQVTAGLQALQLFKNKACSVQAWYWGNNYLLMPPTLMAQISVQAFQDGCTLLQFEPYSYFFDADANALSSLIGMFQAL